VSVEEEGRRRWLKNQPLVDVNRALYRERAHLVAHLAVIYPSVLCESADPEHPDWPVVYVQLPTGQASWHISKSDLDLFEHVTPGHKLWDGHSVAKKYERLDRLTRIRAQNS
jgi:hypothetical protein